METTESQDTLELCLDFSNTVDWRNGRLGKVKVDSLTDYGKLVAWSKDHGLVGEADAKRLGRMTGDAGKGRATLKRAVELRETIYRIFSASAHKRKPENRDLGTLSEFVSESMARSRIIRMGEGFEWSWERVDDAPDIMLWPIAKSAADLLMSDRLEDVGECANEDEGCGWLFLDVTKNHKRRWCSASGCGNRDKVRRFYEKHKEDSA